MEPFIGQVMLFAGNFAPVGWAFCNGQRMSIAENTALFSILGTTYGGDGITTFALPDLRGRAPIGAGTGRGLSPQDLGESSGQESVTLTSANLPTTANIVLVSTEKGTTNAPHTGSVIGNAKGNSFSSSPATTHLNAGSLVPNNIGGNSEPVSTGGPRLAVSYIIALEGIFPSRS